MNNNSLNSIVVNKDLKDENQSLNIITKYEHLDHD